jgi:hypothetical protein
MANREWMRIDAKAGRAWEAPVCLTQSTLRAPRLKSPCCIVKGVMQRESTADDLPAISRNSSAGKPAFPQATTVGSVDAATRRARSQLCEPN